MRWTELLTTPEPTATPVQSVPETPVTVTVAPTVALTPQPAPDELPPDFETEVAFSTSGATKAERYVVLETLRERRQTATSELVWFWVNKLRNRERL